MMQSHTHKHRRRGFALIVASWIIIILVAITLIMAHRMHAETAASGNQVAQVQADAAERGGEQYVLAVADNSDGNAISVTSTPATAIQVGDGYFWILSPNPDDDQNYGYGITDEASKINLNTVSSDMLLTLSSGINNVMADSVVMWRSPANTVTQNGLGTSYYNGLTPPYQCKNANFESVEELLLVAYFTKGLLFNMDLNRDGVIDVGEANAPPAAPANNGNTPSANGISGSSGSSSPFGGSSSGSSFGAMPDDRRGIFNYLTAHTIEPNTTATGSSRININDPNQATRLSSYLSKTLSTSRAAAIMTIVRASIPALPFRNIFDFYFRANLTATEFNLVADKLTITTAATRTGLINVNTASQRVLSCLPGLTIDDATSIITARKAVTDPTNNIAWIVNALSSHSKLIAIGNLITGRSYQFSADIVGVSGDGRAYKRVRIVIDTRQSPPTLLYRKELTDWGWPLDPAIRTTLRSGKPITTGASSTAINGGL